MTASSRPAASPNRPTRRYVGEPPRRTLAAGHVLVIGAICLVLGALFNATALQRSAERQPFGFGRTIAVNLVRPVVAVSSFLRLDRPRAAIDEALDREWTARPVEAAAPENTPTVPPVTVPTTIPVVPADTLERRTIDETRPLGLWIIGDSFAELFGPALVNRATDTGVVDALVDFRFISGLTRPDYFDWPAYITQQLPVATPDAVVVIFGGNDGQDIASGGQILTVGSEGWQAVYAERVGVAMDALVAGTTQVYWVGMPVMASDTFTAKVEMMNAIYRAEAQERAAVTYVDIWDLFQAPGGGYSAYLIGTDGKQRLYRTSDGAHFNWNGAYRLADFVLAAIGDDWGFATGTG